ncbi:MAG: hypothetical protein HQM16_16750 [Deltaproteobacteria bacterium]|nr:hypothetical protein [Deltaproteobacteria bacterium]
MPVLHARDAQAPNGLPRTALSTGALVLAAGLPACASADEVVVIVAVFAAMGCIFSALGNLCQSTSSPEGPTTIAERVAQIVGDVAERVGDHRRAIKNLAFALTDTVCIFAGSDAASSRNISVHAFLAQMTGETQRLYARYKGLCDSISEDLEFVASEERQLKAFCASLNGRLDGAQLDEARGWLDRFAVSVTKDPLETVDGQQMPDGLWAFLQSIGDRLSQLRDIKKALDNAVLTADRTAEVDFPRTPYEALLADITAEGVIISGALLKDHPLHTDAAAAWGNLNRLRKTDPVSYVRSINAALDAQNDLIYGVRRMIVYVKLARETAQQAHDLTLDDSLIVLNAQNDPRPAATRAERLGRGLADLLHSPTSIEDVMIKVGELEDASDVVRDLKESANEMIEISQGLYSNLTEDEVAFGERLVAARQRMDALRTIHDAESLAFARLKLMQTEGDRFNARRVLRESQVLLDAHDYFGAFQKLLEAGHHLGRVRENIFLAGLFLQRAEENRAKYAARLQEIKQRRAHFLRLFDTANNNFFNKGLLQEGDDYLAAHAKEPEEIKGPVNYEALIRTIERTPGLWKRASRVAQRAVAVARGDAQMDANEARDKLDEARERVDAISGFHSDASLQWVKQELSTAEALLIGVSGNSAAAAQLFEDGKGEEADKLYVEELKAHIFAWFKAADVIDTCDLMERQRAEYQERYREIMQMRQEGNPFARAWEFVSPDDDSLLYSFNRILSTLPAPDTLEMADYVGLLNLVSMARYDWDWAREFADREQAEYQRMLEHEKGATDIRGLQRRVARREALMKDINDAYRAREQDAPYDEGQSWDNPNNAPRVHPYDFTSRSWKFDDDQ